MNNVAEKLVKDLNQLEYLNHVKVPILDGFHVVPNEGTLFTAISDVNYIQQFLCDGILDENDSFEEHVTKVMKDIERTMKSAGLEDVDNNIHFLKDYRTKSFTFKVYILDNIAKGKVIRQFNMFFLDPKYRSFYQLSLATSPYPIKDLDYVREELTMNILTTINNLMDNVSV